MRKGLSFQAKISSGLSIYYNFIGSCLSHNHPQGLIMEGFRPLRSGINFLNSQWDPMESKQVQSPFFPKRDRLGSLIHIFTSSPQPLIMRICGPLDSTFQELSNDMWNSKIWRTDQKLW